MQHLRYRCRYAAGGIYSAEVSSGARLVRQLWTGRWRSSGCSPPIAATGTGGPATRALPGHRLRGYRDMPGEPARTPRFSAHPQLVEQQLPERVELVVADARREHDQFAGVEKRYPRRLVGDLPVDVRPARCGRVGRADLGRNG